MDDHNVEVVLAPENIGLVGSLEPLPVLYSLRALEVFTSLLNPFWGSIMMSMNLRRLNRSNAILQLIGGSVVYMGVFVLLNVVFHAAIPIYLWNIIGTVVLHFVIWPRFIGPVLKYVKRSIWKPTIATILVTTWYFWDLYGLYFPSNP